LQYLLVSSFYCFVVLENCRFSLIASNKKQNQLTTRARQRSYSNNKEEYVIEKNILVFNVKSSQINRKETRQFAAQRRENSLYRRYYFIENLVVIN